ncbi:MAG TPA: hypothetical protein VNJ08_01545 [Bacteriovoracaceae bacterium]|nr:hypothetical protein [Bacteriovoracaceae bacterium]
MEDIRSVLSQFNKKKQEKNVEKSVVGPPDLASTSEIPDLFFDNILHSFKLTRSEILLLMYLYRQVWCRPNLYRSHGIGPLNSYADLSLILGLSSDELVHHMHSLENYGFIETVRSGQYFVRKFFTEEFDAKYGQDYDQFF